MSRNKMEQKAISLYTKNNWFDVAIYKVEVYSYMVLVDGSDGIAMYYRHALIK